MVPRFLRNRQMVVTFLVAGAGAVIAEHLLKPNLKRRLKI